MKSFHVVVACLFVCLVGCNQYEGAFGDVEDEFVKNPPIASLFLLEEKWIVVHQDERISDHYGRILAKRNDGTVSSFLIMPWERFDNGHEVKLVKIKHQRTSIGPYEEFIVAKHTWP